MKPVRLLKPKDPIYAEDYNALVAEVERLRRFTIDGPVGTQLEQLAGGPSLTIPRQQLGIWAIVDNEDDTDAPWAWRQQRPIAGGGFQDMLPGLTGTVDKDPLYNPSGAKLSNGSIVFITKGVAKQDGASVQQEWLAISGKGSESSGCNDVLRYVSNVCRNVQGQLRVERTSYDLRTCRIVSRTCATEPSCCPLQPCNECWTRTGGRYRIHLNDFNGPGNPPLEIDSLPILNAGEAMAFQAFVYGYYFSIGIQCVHPFGVCLPSGVALYWSALPGGFNGGPDCPTSYACSADGTIEIAFGRDGGGPPPTGLFSSAMVTTIAGGGGPPVPGPMQGCCEPAGGIPAEMMPENAFPPGCCD